MKRIRTPIITNPQHDLRITWVTEKRVLAVTMIDQASFEHPWDDGDFARLLRRRRNVFCKVAMLPYPEARSEFVAGYILYALHTHHVDIVKLAVDPCYRRLGIGRALVANIFGRRLMLTTLVREGDLQSQLFFRSCGFRVNRADIRRGHFVGPVEDGYVFRQRIKGCRGK